MTNDIAHYDSQVDDNKPFDECYSHLQSASKANKHVKRLNRIIQLLDDMKYNDCYDMISTLRDLNDIRYQINRLEREILGEKNEQL